ncbi:hypothetical protein GCM10025871_13620 [Deinococcus metallilatus]|nr:hypothetical protein GCM10025871_13620 [Deinococcus metallilatus]
MGAEGTEGDRKRRQDCPGRDGIRVPHGQRLRGRGWGFVPPGMLSPALRLSLSRTTPKGSSRLHPYAFFRLARL